MFTTFYSTLQSEISKNSLSKFNLFSYSNVYLLKCTTTKLLSFYTSKKVNLSLNLVVFTSKWSFFFIKNSLFFIAIFLLG